MPIEAYGNGGFRFAGMSHTGSLLILPSGMYGWRPLRFEDVVVEDFSSMMAEREGIDFVLLGTGATVARAPAAIRDLFAANLLSLEMMDTGAAVRTYNVLLAEDRSCGAALIAVD